MLPQGTPDLLACSLPQSTPSSLQAHYLKVIQQQQQQQQQQLFIQMFWAQYFKVIHYLKVFEISRPITKVFLCPQDNSDTSRTYPVPFLQSHFEPGFSVGPMVGCFIFITVVFIKDVVQLKVICCSIVQFRVHFSSELSRYILCLI